MLHTLIMRRQKTSKFYIHPQVPVELVRADSLGKDLLRDGGSTASSGDTVYWESLDIKETGAFEFLAILAIGDSIGVS